MSFSGEQTAQADQTIENDGFYTALSISEFVKDYGVSHSNDDSQIVTLLIDAVFEVNSELEQQKTLWDAQDFTGLAQTTNESVCGQNKHEYLYKKAVFNRAKSDHIGILRGTVRTKPSAVLEGDADDLITKYKNTSDGAVAELKGESGPNRISLL